MRKVEAATGETRQIRRRDTATVVVIATVVMLVLSFTGSLGFVEAIIASAAIGAVATFYHLSVSLSLGAQPSPRPEEAAPAPSGEDAGAAAKLADQFLIEKLPLPVLVIGPGGRIESANPAARQFLGLGSQRGHLSGALRQPSVLEAVSQALKGEAPEPVEYSTLAPIESHVRAVTAPLKVEDDTSLPWRAMLVLFDETSIKRTERMRADFLANASHELRTPLASLSGFIETLRGHAKDDEEARERFLGIMYDQTERMRRLINDLLSLSRVEMDEHVPPGDVVDMTAVAEDVIAFLRPQSDAKSITLTPEMDSDAIAVGDRDQLTEVVQNLIENAIKYSPADATLGVTVQRDVDVDEAEWPPSQFGGDAARLTLASPPGDAPERFVVVRVTDTGKGIDRRDLPRLSERFFRVGGQKSGPKEGTGLGLAIVKHIINRHRGGFTVESKPGSGSVFSVMLPMAARRSG